MCMSMIGRRTCATALDSETSMASGSGNDLEIMSAPYPSIDSKQRHNELRFCCGAARPKRRAEPQQNLPRIGGAGASPPAANAGYVERHRGRLAPVLDLNRRG